MPKQHLRITVIVDNCSDLDLLEAEHGLSILVEKNSKKILFDCGKSGLVLENAQKLGINLSGLEAIVISHGHYDHTGGLLSVIKKNPGVKVYGHPYIFEKKYVKTGKGYRYIGTPEDRDNYEKNGANFILSEYKTEVIEGIFTTGQIPRTNDFESVDESFQKIFKGKYEKDEIYDDISLIIKWQDSIVLLLGCAHSGLVNILKRAKEISGKDAFLLVEGGMHLSNKDSIYVKNIFKDLKKIKIDHIIPMHCTGRQHSNLFSQFFGKSFKYGAAGKIMDFKE